MVFLKSGILYSEEVERTADSNYCSAELVGVAGAPNA
jgi:hypothetical protein